MKTQFCVFNDRNVTMMLQVQDNYIVEHGFMTPVSTYYRIEPQTTKTVPVNIPDGTIPYIKIWETGQAFISYVNAESL